MSVAFLPIEAADTMIMGVASPCNYASYRIKNRSGIVDTNFQDGSMSISLSFLPIKTANTVTLEGCDYAVVCLPKMYN